MTSLLTPPESLYRFGTFSGAGRERLQTLLTSNHAYLATRAELNDPFEDHVFAEQPTTLAQRREMEKFFKARMPESVRALPPAKRIVATQVARAKAQYSDMTAWFRKNILARYGLMCFSESRDDLLLWSHYAEGHRGFCIEFDAKLLMQHAQMSNGESVALLPMPANYCDACPKVSLFELREDSASNQKWLRDVLATKARQWSYEREWRVVPVAPAHGAFRFVKNPVRALILGCAASKEDIEFAQSLGAKLVRSRKHRSEYRLEFN